MATIHGSRGSPSASRCHAGTPTPQPHRGRPPHTPPIFHHHGAPAGRPGAVTKPATDKQTRSLTCFVTGLTALLNQPQCRHEGRDRRGQREDGARGVGGAGRARRRGRAARPGRVGRPGGGDGRVRRGVRRRAQLPPRRTGVRRPRTGGLPRGGRAAGWSTTRSPVPYLPEMAHHLGKAEAEHRVRRSGLDWTILQPGVYLQNFDLTAPVEVPYDVHARFGFLDLADLGQVAATVLLDGRARRGDVRAGQPERQRRRARDRSRDDGRAGRGG